METQQSMVLLTAGEPRLNKTNVLRRLRRWTGFEFSEEKDETENFFVAEETGEVAMAKLDGEYIFLVTLLNRSYWDSEDIQPYVAQAEMDSDVRLLRYLRSCRGAILVDALNSPNLLQGFVYLAKVAAALMENDTPVLVVRISLKASMVSSEMRSALGRAASPADLMPWAINFQLFAEEESHGVALTMGMQQFGLPNVAMRCTADNAHEAAGAVQSLAAYQVHCGKPMPVGDTMTIPNHGDLRCVPADRIDPRLDSDTCVGLEWM